MIPPGRLVEYVHTGCEPLYERCTLIRVQRGHVLQRQDLDAEQYDACRAEEGSG